MKNEKISLKKSQLYGENRWNYHDDWELINNEFSEHSIKKTRVKEFEISYGHNLINFINFTYQITTDKGVFELRGNEFGKKLDFRKGRLFHYFLSDDEIIKEIVINDREWAAKVINGLQIKTSRNDFSFGLQGYKYFIPKDENLVLYGQSCGFVDGIGFYCSDYKDSNEEIENYYNENQEEENKSSPANEVNEFELESLKKQGIKASDWLDRFYPKNRDEISSLDLANKNLTGELDLNDFVNLEWLNCSSNQITSLKLDDCRKIRELRIDTINNLNNSSLQQFKNLKELLFLDVTNSKFDTGLQYLPSCLKDFYCRYTRLFEEFAFYNYNLKNWQLSHPELMTEVNGELIEKEKNDYRNAELITTITAPEFLDQEKFKSFKLTSDDQLINLGYNAFVLQDKYPLNWEIQLGKNSNRLLPLRLYNLETNQVKMTSNNQINNYLILSYCWGTDWEKNPQSYGQIYLTDLTKLGRKALNKVQSFYQYFNKVNHIWIDNFCINQSDRIEKGQEVRKQKQYYSQATVTLIAIDAEVGNQIDKTDKLVLVHHLINLIVKSSWFTRSWTLQEGLLSKQTVFMFDDALVDGRILAQYWGGGAQTKLKSGQIETNCQDAIIHITPLGWSYGSHFQHSVNLTLGEALLAVQNRKKTVPIDGIYSILGLLPYGDKVETKYKTDKNYSVEELENSLEEVIKVAYNNGHYIDILSWIGSRNNKLIPSIDENGVSNVTVFNDWWRENIASSISTINNQKIKLINAESLIVVNIWKNDKYSSIISVLTSEKEEVVNLYHEESLKIQKGDNLVFFKKEKTLNESTEEVVLLIPGNKSHDIWICKYNSFVKLKPCWNLLIDLEERKVIKLEKSVDYDSESCSDVEKLIYSCDQCNKEIKDSYFSDREKNIYFCSSDCQSQWQISKKENFEGDDGLNQINKLFWVQDEINEMKITEVKLQKELGLFSDEHQNQIEIPAKK